MAQNVNVNIVPQSYLPEFRVSQGDVGRTMIATILDSNGAAFDIPDDSTVTFVGTKPSGLGFTINCTYADNVVTFTSAETMDNEVGPIECEIRITDANENRIGTCNVSLIVERDPHPDDTTDGDVEPLINRITALLTEITEAHADAMEDISEAKQNALNAIQADVDAADSYRLVSEGYAAGTQNGTPVASGTYYENNAKYYSELAEQTAATSGYMHFYINDNGYLILERTDNVVVTFTLSDGYLYVEAA